MVNQRADQVGSWGIVAQAIVSPGNRAYKHLEKHRTTIYPNRKFNSEQPFTEYIKHQPL